jgi:hypothetical protein
MKSMNVRIRKTLVSLAPLLLLSATLAPRAAEAVTYGWTDADGQSSDATRIGYYSSSQLDLYDGDAVKGFARLAGGFHAMDNAQVYITHVAEPVGGNIELGDGAVLHMAGDLQLSSTAVLVMGGTASIDANGGAMILNGNLALPGQAIVLLSDLVIDGQDHAVAFNASTLVDLGGQTLTLRNMTIRGLNGIGQFTGIGTLVLDHCIVDIGSGVTFSYTPANLEIDREMVIRGGGTFRFGGTGTLTIRDNSTLRVEPWTTLDYNSNTRNSLLMSSNTSRLELDHCTLKAQGMEGLVLTTGMLIVNGEVTADNGMNTIRANGIQLGDGTTSLNVLFKSGARFKALGALWYNRP